jgi:hypothetical protein
MGTRREFYFAMLFVMLGMFLAWLICIYTPIKEWLGLIQYLFVIFVGMALGQLLLLLYCGIYLLLKGKDNSEEPPPQPSPQGGGSQTGSFEENAAT